MGKATAMASCTRARAMVLLFVAGLVMAACGTGAGESGGAPATAADSFEAPAPEAANGAVNGGVVNGGVVNGGVGDVNTAGAGSRPSAGAPATTVAPPQLPALATEPGRQEILTGSLDLKVPEVAPVVAKVIVAVQGLGGLVAGEQSDYATKSATSVLTVKVPPEKFRPALGVLAGLGEVTAENVGTQDVTAQVVDLDSRIQTAAVSVERLRSYLAQAKTTADVAALEGELLRRETDLETLRGQLRSVQDQVALATIVVTLRTGDDVATAAATHGSPGFADAVEGGLRALVSVGSAIALVVGAVLPWLPVAFALTLLWLIARGLTHRRRVHVLDGPPPSAPPAPAVEEREPEPVG